MWLQIWTLQVLLIPDPSGTSFILSFLFWFSSQRLGGEAQRLQERIKLLLSHSRTDPCRARSPARLGLTGTPFISPEISRSMGHRCLHYPPWDIVNWAGWGEWRVQREGRKGKRCLGWDLPWWTFCSKLLGENLVKMNVINVFTRDLFGLCTCFDMDGWHLELAYWRFYIKQL